ncbi:MAG TPA: hypothetical protein PKA90_10885 [Ignavibacteria bacterium]|nr:hypothetical protein [Ignavibacteria bacterium]
MKLQGEWVLAKDPMIGEVAVVYLKINFKKNKFGLQRIYRTDVAKREEGEFYIEGDFKSDENFIYLNGIYQKEINSVGDEEKVKKNYKEEHREFIMYLRYKFSNDTLIFKEAYNNTDLEKTNDDFENGRIHYLFKIKP